MLETWLPLLGGLALLIVGGELLVRGAVQVAERLGVSPLVIGLTLVGFGTSAPELVVSVQAALSGSPGIAYGNIVGSNISNILLVGGISAMLFPLAVTSMALKRDGLVMLAATVAFIVLSSTMPLGRLVGLSFLTALGAYIYLAFRTERVAEPDHGAVYDKSLALQETHAALTPQLGPARSLLLSALTAIAGLVIVLMGGRLFVDGAVALARGLGMSESLIGLTIVAVGTSMPELVTSIVAALRRQGDVAFGNILGSNIYNILSIGGATALLSPGAVPADIVGFNSLIMLGVSVVLVAFAWTGWKIVRWEGAVLLVAYLAYVFAIWPKA